MRDLFALLYSNGEFGKDDSIENLQQRSEGQLAGMLGQGKTAYGLNRIKARLVGFCRRKLSQVIEPANLELIAS